MVNKALDVVPGLEGNSARKGFVIKTYSLVTLMIAVTALWTALVYTNISLAIWVFSNLWLYYVMLIVTLAIMCSMICHKTQMFREVPKNYIVAGIFTITHAYLVGAITAQYDP